MQISGGVQLSGGVNLAPGGSSPSPSHVFQGSNYGYTSGGYDGSSNTNIIDKFPFATDNDATDVGDLTVARGVLTGQQY